MEKEKTSEVVECVICTKAIQIFAVHQCGHYTCHMCALRMRKMGKELCPICRKDEAKLFLTTEPTLADDTTVDISSLDTEKFYYDKALNCFYETYSILNAIDLLRCYFCPKKQCWPGGKQEPFVHFEDLKHHLWHDHGVNYCEVCLKHKPAFLCEQNLYQPQEMEPHMKGESEADEMTFTGHPYCAFCKIYVYDTDMFVVHMRDQHMTCDLCQRLNFPNRFFHNSTTMYRHFEKDHHVCKHPDCEAQDMMLRVFGSDLELHTHFTRNHGAKSGKRVPVGPDSFGFRYGNDVAQIDAAHQNGPEAAAQRANTITFDFGTHRKEYTLLKGQRGRTSSAHAEDHFISNLSASLPTASVHRSHRSENARLWAAVRSSLGSEEKLFAFREKCTQYLNGNLRAMEYHREAQAAFGKNFTTIFPKLIELLPDVMKKEALLAIHNTQTTTEMGKPDLPPPPAPAPVKKKHDPRYRKAVLEGTRLEKEEANRPVSTVVAVPPPPSAPPNIWGVRSSPQTSMGSPALSFPDNHVDVTNTEDFPTLNSRGAKKPKPKPKGQPNVWARGSLASKLRDD